MVEMVELRIEGVDSKDLKSSLGKMEEFQKWVADEKIDKWAARAALLKALHDNAEEYFAQGKGTFREIAAFDNGVGTALDALKKNNEGGVN
ncbi:MAG: hypothetical protein M1368_10155 [Thaumarchaeota archaeon]|nr:hypothetical protein [Nitrososphaerota archaeon]